MRHVVAVLAVLASCGDNAPPCGKPQRGLTEYGPISDPYAVDLGPDCVEHGLYNLPGRWMLVDSTQRFIYEYPRFEGSCPDGLVQLGAVEDQDATDGTTFQMWSDGTRYFELFDSVPTAGVEYTTSLALCMTSDHDIKAIRAYSTTGAAPMMYAEAGTRFGPKDSPADGLALVGEVGKRSDGTSISALNLVVDGGLAYVAGFAGLDIVDVGDPAHPVEIGHLDGRFNDVQIAHGTGKLVAFAAPIDGVGQTSIIDVTVPATPVVVGFLPYSHSLHITNDGASPQLYLADYTTVVPRYDLSDPIVPILSGRASLPELTGGVHDLYVDGPTLFVNDSIAGFVALDTSPGFDQAVQIGHLATSYSHTSWAGDVGGRHLVLHGDEGMTASADGAAFLRVLDGDPHSPTFMTELGRYQSRPEVSIHNFTVVGTRAYIAYYQDGVRIVDLSDPSAPREVAHYNTWDDHTAPGGTFEGALGVRVANGLIYVADSLRGLVILRET